ncbi:hypothetical protein [Variovorax sp. 770b2]|uniref:hypothetical protein n=1 Tax=Variovorax sp. 770b2 TaxID=1566271 RepID=UPI00210AE165|nr:hypothetical protein [Variovorax sp. 770b2]
MEKDDYWEYRLTAEVLRFEMEPVLQRWGALKRGLYVKPNSKINHKEFISWFQLKLGEITSISKAFTELANNEFSRAWGEPGTPGNDKDIVVTARLFSEMCQSSLNWEEEVRFTSTDEIFYELQNLFIGTAGRIIDEAAKLPLFLSETLSNNPVDGRYKLELVLSLADGWGEKIDEAFARAQKNYIKALNK